MDVEVNLWAVLGGFVASMVVGSIWYSRPVFGRVWQKMVGLDDKTMREASFQPFFRMVPMALLQAYVLAHVTYLAANFLTDYTWMGAALSTAFWMWFGFQLTVIVIHDAFELRRLKLSLINAGNQLATLMAMGLVIGWLQP